MVGRPIATDVGYVRLGASCTYGTILHEIGHALGLHHEHQRADAPFYVDVLKENIKDGEEEFLVPFTTGGTVAWGEYNYRSIMHYSANAFSTDANLDTLVPILNIPDGLMGQRMELTRGDISAVNSLYPSFIIPGDHNSLSWRWPARFSDEQATDFATGDFDGDGLDDVVAFAKGFQGDANRGDVNVALSKQGGGFHGRQFWHGWFCINSEICKVADVNGDGRDDILAFTSTGTVWVALSQDVDGDGFGDRFAESSIWHSNLRPAEQILLGDVDGDGDDDLVIVGGASPGQPRSVGIYFSDLVATATGTDFSSTYTTRRFRDVQSQAPITASQFLMLGDVDGDGRADAVVAYEGIDATSMLFVRRSVRSILSWTSQAKFAANDPWGESICGWGIAYCHLADMNGDGLADVVWLSGHLGRFVEGTSGPISSSHALERVQIQLSLGSLFVRLPLYHEMDCRDRLWGCLLADVDGDGLTDIVDPIERSEESPTNHRYAGDIFVSTSTGIWTP